MLVMRHGRFVECPWRHLDDAAPLAAWGFGTVSLARFERERAALLARRIPLGVRLGRGDPEAAVAGDLGCLAMIAIEVARAADLAALRKAWRLRTRHGWTGELRAIGNVVPQSIPLLLGRGFDTLEVAGIGGQALRQVALEARCGARTAPRTHFMPAWHGGAARSAERRPLRAS